MRRNGRRRYDDVIVVKRRLLLKLALLLILLGGGAIVNVAVAFGSVYSDVPLELSRMSDDDAIAWSKGAPADNETIVDLAAVNLVPLPETDCFRYLWHSSARVSGWRLEQAVFEWRNIKGWDCRDVVTGSPRGPLLAVRTFAGWPASALSCLQHHQRGARGTMQDVSVDWHTVGAVTVGLEPAWGGRPRVLPYRPIWPGFAINTVFYAFVLWLLFATPFALRRRRRIKRGLCPKCAYDLRGIESQICPECGNTSGISRVKVASR